MHPLTGPVDLTGPVRTQHPEEVQSVLERIPATSPFKCIPFKFFLYRYSTNGGASLASPA